ncbi:MAG TPA: nucleotide exchange factor GrpE [Hyphomicrobiaceae bacterium]|jgi:molecular chaperone GrpE|nr:nucleotide exchange factor GrpE [Hyphomicrobiaceae bacterium]
MANTTHGDFETGKPADTGSDPAAAGNEPAPVRDTPKHPDDIIAALRAETADLKDKLLRAHAEVENIRKRSEREREDTAKYAVTRLARDMVTVGDNFQRAIEAVPAGAAETDPALKSFLDGMTLIERELINVLERHGIRRIEPLNEPFNPHFHQAVMELARSDVPAGTVVQMFQAGYMIEDRVLRPAMVAVAKGAPRVPVPAEPGPPEAGPVANGNEPPSGPKAS